MSGAALICALAANGKMSKLAAVRPDDVEASRALKRSGIIAIVVTALALVINIVSAIFLYPMVSDTMQSGDWGSLMGSESSTGTSGGNSTWG